MKKNIRKVINFVVVTALFFLLLGSHVQAKSNKIPVIVSKKIIVQPDITEHKKTPSILKTHAKKPALKPKSDISNIHSIDDEKDFFAALSYANNKIPKPYDSNGKIDPFKPMFYKKQAIVDHLTPVNSDRKNKTKLEKIDLSQIRLSGIVISKNGNKGLVEESTGKGHVISVGTYIGTRGGKVVNISKGKVIVEEKMKNIYGEIVVKKRELKMIKKTDAI